MAQEDVVSRMFRWWNDAVRTHGFTEEGFGRYFTPEARLVVNGDERAVGLAALTAHFQRIGAGVEAAAIRLPLEHQFQAGGEIFVQYRVDVVSGGAAMAEEAMGYAVIQDGKIQLLTVTSREIV